MSLTKNSIAVVTGAASGIGRALAVKLAQEKIAGLAISDINETGLRETANLVAASGVKCTTHTVNVADREQMRLFADQVAEKHGGASHLINNAGVALIGDFEDISLEDFEWLMGINFWGVVYGAKFFLPILKQQPAAHIVNLSSIFGIIAPPGQTAYSSSKFAVRGFTESLRHELEGTNVFVSSVHPGGIKTSIAKSAKIGAGTDQLEKELGVEFFDKASINTSEYAAETIVRGIKAKRARIIVGGDARVLSLIQRLFPRNYIRVAERLSGMKFRLKKLRKTQAK
jgi:NAD(P)-dependent dehydrogenase (short-subunit alcohol dehydrogenase family)